MVCSVVVLAPNGRRQIVKVTPNTGVIQILEEVSKKQGYDVNDYDLRHHKMILNLNSDVRFSNLPNNAQLEMIPTTRIRSDEAEKVMICLQLESGDRLKGEFHHSASLWNILNSWEEKESLIDLVTKEKENIQNNAREPVCVYMRSEIKGEDQLRKTSLKSLGIISGKAMIRFFQRPPELIRGQANVCSPLAARAVKPESYEEDLCNDGSKGVVRISQSPDMLLSSTSGDDLSGARVHSEQTDLSMEVELPTPECSVNEFQSLSGDLNVTQPQVGTAEVPGRDDDKMLDVDVCRSRGSKEAELQMDELKQKINYIGPRNSIIFNRSKIELVKNPNNDLSDDFYELSVDDLRLRQAELRQNRIALEQFQICSVKEMEREARRQQSLNEFPFVIVRIQFPDGLVIQAEFHPQEPIRNVEEFVRSFLVDPGLAFHLYTTPPKTILDQSTSFFEAGLLPSVLVHFGALCPSSSANSNSNRTDESQTSQSSEGGNGVYQQHQQQTYIREEIRMKLTPPEAVMICVKKRRKERISVGAECPQSQGIHPDGNLVQGTANAVEDGWVASADSKEGEEQARNGKKRASSSVIRSDLTTDASTSNRHFGDPGTGAVPKWFKPGKS